MATPQKPKNAKPKASKPKSAKPAKKADDASQVLADMKKKRAESPDSCIFC